MSRTALALAAMITGAASLFVSERADAATCRTLETPAKLSAQDQALAGDIHAFVAALEGTGVSGSLLVAHGDQLLVRTGFGRISAGDPICAKPGTVFDTMSFPKQFTAAAILLLAEDGKLSLQDPIAKHLPNVPEDKQAITIAQLLLHIAGLPATHGKDTEVIGKEVALRRIFAAPLKSVPGDAHFYSNSGFTLLAAIIEARSGEDYVSFVRRRLLQPAGIGSTGVPNEPMWAGREAFTGYLDGKPSGVVTTRPGPSWTTMGNGEWLSTTADLHRWLRALRGGKLLPQPQIARMNRSYLTTSDGRGWGLGTQIFKTALGPAVGHGGTGEGGNMTAFYYPEHDVTIVAYGNQIGFRDIKEPEGTLNIHPAYAINAYVAELAARRLASPAAVTATPK